MAARRRHCAYFWGLAEPVDEGNKEEDSGDDKQRRVELHRLLMSTRPNVRRSGGDGNGDPFGNWSDSAQTQPQEPSRRQEMFETADFLLGCHLLPTVRLTCYKQQAFDESTWDSQVRQYTISLDPAGLEMFQSHLSQQTLQTRYLLRRS